MKNKTNKRNSKILRETMVTLGALKGASSALSEMHIHEIQVHLLDECGDGVILCLEYETSDTGATEVLNKTFSCVDEFYDDTIEVEFEDDACNSPENREEMEMTRETDFIEEAISEEYDEIFHSVNKKLSPLLN